MERARAESGRLQLAGHALADTIRRPRIPDVGVHVSNLLRAVRPTAGRRAGRQCVVMGIGVHGHVLELDAAFHLTWRAA